MKKREILIVVVCSVIILTGSTLKVIENNQPKEQPIEIQSKPPAPIFVGNTYLMTYYPADDQNIGLIGVAQRYNNHNYRITFQGDGTYMQRSNQHIYQLEWDIRGDSIYLSNEPFKFQPLGNSYLLNNRFFKVELTPLR